jgi:hypothetical protein
VNTKPIRVTWTRSDELRCAMLAGMGFSTKLIVRETGLSPCQVTYRLNKARIKRADYRNGTSYLAHQHMAELTTDAETIRRLLKLRIIKLKMPVRGFEK